MNCRVVIEKIENAISEGRMLLAQETDPERSRRIREGILFLANGATVFEWLREEAKVANPKPKRRPAECCVLRP
jgi:hypothetical protein